MKIPDQVYVTAKKSPKYDNGVIVGYDTPLGFLHPWNPKKPGDSKYHTQREWAYRSYANDFKMEERNGHLWISGWKWKDNAKVTVGEFADPQPQVWDNEPMNGFKIVKSVSRYSTSNKLWRVLDPRGIEFEISTGCLEEIIDNATILKGGVIDAPCAWQANKNLVVV